MHHRCKIHLLLRGVASCFMIDNDASWCIIRYHWCIMHHDRSWCKWCIIDPWSIMINHDPSWSIMMHHDPSWCTIDARFTGCCEVLHHASWSSMMHHYVLLMHHASWSIMMHMMHHDPQWCIMHHDVSCLQALQRRAIRFPEVGRLAHHIGSRPEIGTDHCK